MSELVTFMHLGFRHITDLEAFDHILFLLALAAIYRGRDWRDLLWVVTAFTVGHSITLALAVTGTLRLPTPPDRVPHPGDDRRDRRREHPGAPTASARPSGAGTARCSRASSDWYTAPGSPTTCTACSPAPSWCRCSGSISGSSWASSWCWRWPASRWPELDRALGATPRDPATPSVHRLRVLAVSGLVVVVATEMAVAAAALVAWAPRGSRFSRSRSPGARAHPMHTAVVEMVQEDAARLHLGSGAGLRRRPARGRGAAGRTRPPPTPPWRGICAARSPWPTARAPGARCAGQGAERRAT